MKMLNTEEQQTLQLELTMALRCIHDPREACGHITVAMAVLGLTEPDAAKPTPFVKLTAAEVQSGLDRVRWAEVLISQLPEDHDGRNSWLMNYGSPKVAAKLRARWAERTGRQWIVAVDELASHIGAANTLAAATGQVIEDKTARPDASRGNPAQEAMQRVLAGQVVDAEFVDPAAVRPHPRAELLTKWLNDTTLPIWRWIESKHLPGMEWERCTSSSLIEQDHPCKHFAVGAKPTSPPRRMCTLAGVEFPAPETAAPVNSTGYWFPTAYGRASAQFSWMDADSFHRQKLASGLVHLNKDAAEQHGRALLAANQQAIEAAR